MKKSLLLLATIAPFFLYSQVGVNIQSPKATLHVVGKNTDATKPDGVIAPILTGDELKAKDAVYTAAQTGAIIYASAPVTISSTKTVNVTTPGYYYFNGTLWTAFTNSITSGDPTKDAWLDNAANSRVELGTLSNGATPRPIGTEMVIKDGGNVGIGTSSPSINSILELSSSNKGFLMPRVNLQSTDDLTTIDLSTPALRSSGTGMLVYQLADVGSGVTRVRKGQVYKFDGTKWLQLIDGTGVPSQTVSVSAPGTQNIGNSINYTLVTQLTNESVDLFGAWANNEFTVPAGEDGVYSFSYQSYNTHGNQTTDEWYVISVLQRSLDGGATWSTLTKDTRSGIKPGDVDNGNILFWSGNLSVGDKVRIVTSCNSTASNIVTGASLIVSSVR